MLSLCVCSIIILFFHLISVYNLVCDAFFFTCHIKVHPAIRGVCNMTKLCWERENKRRWIPTMLMSVRHMLAVLRTWYYLWGSVRVWSRWIVARGGLLREGPGAGLATPHDAQSHWALAPSRAISSPRATPRPSDGLQQTSSDTYEPRHMTRWMNVFHAAQDTNEPTFLDIGRVRAEWFALMLHIQKVSDWNLLFRDQLSQLRFFCFFPHLSMHWYSFIFKFMSPPPIKANECAELLRTQYAGQCLVYVTCNVIRKVELCW